MESTLLKWCRIWLKNATGIQIVLRLLHCNGTSRFAGAGWCLLFPAGTRWFYLSKCHGCPFKTPRLCREWKNGDRKRRRSISLPWIPLPAFHGLKRSAFPLKDFPVQTLPTRQRNPIRFMIWVQSPAHRFSSRISACSRGRTHNLEKENQWNRTTCKNDNKRSREKRAPRQTLLFFKKQFNKNLFLREIFFQEDK